MSEMMSYGHVPERGEIRIRLHGSWDPGDVAALFRGIDLIYYAVIGGDRRVLQAQRSEDVLRIRSIELHSPGEAIVEGVKKAAEAAGGVLDAILRHIRWKQRRKDPTYKAEQEYRVRRAKAKLDRALREEAREQEKHEWEMKESRAQSQREQERHEIEMEYHRELLKKLRDEDEEHTELLETARESLAARGNLSEEQIDALREAISAMMDIGADAGCEVA